MAHSLINVVLLRLASRDQITILELHGLGTLRAQLPADDDLAALRAVLHDEAHDAVAGATNGQASHQLELHGLGTLRAQLPADDDLAALRAVLHDEAHDAVAGAAHREAAEQLVAERLS